MSLPRSLAPYAATALLILAGSLAALAFSLPGDGPARPTAPGPSAGAARPLADAQALALQLGTPHLAYWREDEGGRRRLWVSDALGSRQWSIGAPTARDEARYTRWSPDGAAVAYIAAAKELVVVRLNGATVRLPAWRDEDAAEARRILGYVWSSDGRRIATTQRRGVGSTSPTDVFVADLALGRWSRATTAGDVHVAEWAGPEEILVETGRGLIGLLQIGETDAIRPLTGMPAASPSLGPDGRITFGGGSVMNEPSFTETRYVMGSIWSTTSAGDAREEARPAPQQFRLEGRWPDGQFIISVPGGLKLASGGNLPLLAGNIRRVAVAPDGSSAYGITERRILRLDIALAGRSPTAPGAASVVLDQAEEADVWFPRAPVAIARPPATSSGTAPERHAFLLAGRIWMSDGQGTVRAIHAAPPTTWFLRPRWSPDGERLLVVEVVRIGDEQRYSILLFDRAGRLTRLDESTARRWVSSVTWSPEGDRFAVAGGAIGAWFQGEVRVLDVGGAEVGPRIPGREAAWTDSGLFVLGNGRDDEQRPGTQARVGHSIDRISGGTRQTITDADQLARDPRSGVAPGVAAGLNRLAVSADGSHVSAYLYGGSGREQSLAIVRTSDGAPTSFVSSEPGRGTINDVEWSPRGALVGHTRETWSETEPMRTSSASAIVRNGSGEVIAERDGRFAGWSADGAWFYVSRTAGLFGYRVDGTAERTIGPLGVSVVTTRP